ncbi:MAG: methyltransferase domain-containing protein [Deltaproteobacteria bacterium]|nr:methyltransferase domain-containing protein [Deltaproteobacteria bacterium]
MSIELIWSTSAGIQLLERATAIAEEAAYDPAATALRANKKLSDAAPELTRRAVEIVFTRRQAAFLGSWTAQGLFTRESIEQASHPTVAAHHAKKFSGCRHLLEVGCGIGSDTAAFARVCTRVTSFEKQENIAVMARHNLAAQGIKNVEVIHADATVALSSFDMAAFDALWSDPARRDGGGNRVYNPNDWSPSLDFVLNLPCSGPRGIKISPGSNLTLSPGVVREWIGLESECVEQTLWRGTAVLDGTVFLADAAYEWIPPATSPEAEVFPIENAAGHWFVEPHAALIRSSHLSAFYHSQNFKLLDTHIAYGVSNTAPPTHPLYRAFKILEVFPYSLSTLNERLQQRRWNTRTEIKKRGFSETTDELRLKLKLLPPKDPASSFGVIFVTRIGAAHFVILAERI